MPETPSWEFLLQQDGDRAWLSIDPPTVEILEGRYRVAAKSTCKNVAVEVLIRHDATEEDPPKRRIQKRLDRTNQKGLMVVIPYTELQPGLWEFRCTQRADSAESKGQTYCIQFQVLPRETDTLEDWNFDWGDAIDEEFDSFSAPEESPAPSSAVGETPSAAIAEVVEVPSVHTPAPETFPVEATPALAQEEIPLAGKSIDEILQLATQQSNQLADEVLHEYGLTSDDEVPSEASPATPIRRDPLPTSPSEPELPPLSIVLEQDTYIVQRGQTLDLCGELRSESAQEPLTLSQVELSICLRDPQTAEVLLETRKNLENQTVPSALTYRLKLPETWNTQLVLGELILRDRTRAATPILASQSFTLTADVQDLLDAIRQRKAAEVRLDRSIAQKVLESTTASANAPLNLTFLNFVQSPKTPQDENFVPVTGQILPPQLYPSAAPGTEKRSIELPFSDPPPEPSSEIPTQLEIPLPTDFAEPSTEPLQTEESLAADIEQLEIELDAADTAERDPFIDRLNTLAENATSSEELKAVAADVIDSSDLPEELVALLPPFTAMEIAPNPDPSEDEFVVDDELILPVTDLVRARQQEVAEAALSRPVNPLFLPEDQPVPEPAIFLAETELETGKPVPVTVQLPDVFPKIYVKLWINDRQNRSVLEPPRWIVDFTPNGLGKLEATTELRVPMGSVDVQIEAVTVEVMTNRESRKVSLDRRVLASEPSSFSVEDLNV
jgi:hypothetical protein